MGGRGQGLKYTAAVGKTGSSSRQFLPMSRELASDIPITGFALVTHRHHPYQVFQRGMFVQRAALLLRARATTPGCRAGRATRAGRRCGRRARCRRPDEDSGPVARSAALEGSTRGRGAGTRWRGVDRYGHGLFQCIDEPQRGLRGGFAQVVVDERIDISTCKLTRDQGLGFHPRWRRWARLRSLSK